MGLPPWTRTFTRDLMSGSLDEVANRIRTAVTTSELPATALRGLDRVMRETRKGAEQVRRWARRHASLSHSAVNGSGIYFHGDLASCPLAAEQLQTLIPEAELFAGNLPAQRERIVRQLDSLVNRRWGGHALVANSTAAAIVAAAASVRESSLYLPRCCVFRPDGQRPLPELLKAGGGRLVEVGTAEGCELADWAQLNDDTCASAALFEVHWPTAAQRPSPAWSCGEQSPAANCRRISLLPYGCWEPLDEALAEACTPLNAELLERNWLTIVPGNRLLGGPRSALILGSRAALATVEAAEIWPVLAADLGTVAALVETLQQPNTNELSLARLLRPATENLQNRGERLATQLAGSPAIAEVQITSGPARLATDLNTEIPSRQLRIRHASLTAESWAERLRADNPALLTSIAEDQLALDLRWIPTHLDEHLAALLCGQTAAAHHADSPHSDGTGGE